MWSQTQARAGEESSAYYSSAAGRPGRGVKKSSSTGSMTYESNGTVYFVNGTAETKERQAVTPSGQRIMILGKAVNAEHLCSVR